MNSALFVPALNTKREIDTVIRHTEDKLVVLRFGRDTDSVCMELDNMLGKTAELLSRMAEFYTVDVDNVPVYTSYFDITIIPSLIFFYNGQHMKCDYGTEDHTKWIGCFRTKQDLIDLVEVMCRGAQRGKLIVTSPIPRENVPKYTLIFQDI